MATACVRIAELSSDILWAVWQELEGSNLDCAMAQHLLVAADRFQLPRLRRICERRLCETVEVGCTFEHSLACCSTSLAWICSLPVNCTLFYGQTGDPALQWNLTLPRNICQREQASKGCAC